MKKNAAFLILSLLLLLVGAAPAQQPRAVMAWPAGQLGTPTNFFRSNLFAGTNIFIEFYSTNGAIRINSGTQAVVSATATNAITKIWTNGGELVNPATALIFTNGSNIIVIGTPLSSTGMVSFNLNPAIPVGMIALTNLSYTIGANATSFVYSIGANTTNFAYGIGANATNFAYSIGANATNFAYGIGANATNFTYAIGANTTNFAYGIGANATSFVYSIGANLTNYANTAATNAATNAVTVAAGANITVTTNANTTNVTYTIASTGGSSATNLISAGDTNATHLSLVSLGTNTVGMVKTVKASSNVTITEEGQTNLLIAASIVGGTASLDDVTNAVTTWGLTNDGALNVINTKQNGALILTNLSGTGAVTNQNEIGQFMIWEDFNWSTNWYGSNETGAYWTFPTKSGYTMRVGANPRGAFTNFVVSNGKFWINTTNLVQNIGAAGSASVAIYFEVWLTNSSRPYIMGYRIQREPNIVSPANSTSEAGMHVWETAGFPSSGKGWHNTIWNIWQPGYTASGYHALSKCTNGYTAVAAYPSYGAIPVHVVNYDNCPWQTFEFGNIGKTPGGLDTLFLNWNGFVTNVVDTNDAWRVWPDNPDLVWEFAFSTNAIGVFGMDSIWTRAAPDVLNLNASIASTNGSGTNTSLYGTSSLYGAALSYASSASNGPAANELPTAGWVRSLFSEGATYYSSTNLVAIGTNDASGDPLRTFQSDLCTNSGVLNYDTTGLLVNGGYLSSTVTTNTFSSMGGSLSVNSYIGFSGGSSTPTLTVKPEFYYSYDRTNWYGDYAGSYETITHGQTNLYTWAVTFPSYTSTNSAGFYVQRRFKVGTVTGAGTRVATFLVGTNFVGGVTLASHVLMQSPSATAGNAYLANNQTFTGSNYFSGDITAAVTNGPLRLVRGDWATNIVRSLAVTSVGSNGVIYAATNINFVGNTLMTNSSGVISINVTPSSGTSLQTNADQFAANVVLNIKKSANLTNVVLWEGGNIAEGLTVTNQTNNSLYVGEIIVTTNMMVSALTITNGITNLGVLSVSSNASFGTATSTVTNGPTQLVRGDWATNIAQTIANASSNSLYTISSNVSQSLVNNGSNSLYTISSNVAQALVNAGSNSLYTVSSNVAQSLATSAANTASNSLYTVSSNISQSIANASSNSLYTVSSNVSQSLANNASNSLYTVSSNISQSLVNNGSNSLYTVSSNISQSLANASSNSLYTISSNISQSLVNSSSNSLYTVSSNISQSLANNASNSLYTVSSNVAVNAALGQHNGVTFPVASVVSNLNQIIWTSTSTASTTNATNVVAVDGLKGDNVIGISTNTWISGVTGGSADNVLNFSILLTNGCGAAQPLVFQATNNVWKWSYAQSATAPSTLTNATQLLIQARMQGTNILAAYAYYAWP